MAVGVTIAIVRVDADAELATSVRTVLEAMPKDQLGKLHIEEPQCSRAGTFSEVCRRARADLTILIESTECPFIAPAENGAGKRGLRGPLLVVLPEGLAQQAPHLMKAGVSDFILTPIRPWDLIPRVLHSLRPLECEDELMARLKQLAGPKQIIGQSPVLMTQLRKLPLIAGCDATVLITGETGTGKELCARAIHYLSRRYDKAFTAVDCGAIPSEVIENELFGHERGAYTSATTAQRGLLQESEGGTLFLDEVDSLSPGMQAKLRRFLQEKEYRPLGSPKTRHADVRVIAASNTPLEEAVQAGKFRPDLYYRLNVLSLAVPPLRHRREDIPILARYFITKYAEEFSRPARDITEEAVEQLLSYSWPGNARELENLMERAVLACNCPIVDVRDVEVPTSEAYGESLLYQARKDLMVANWERNELKKMLTIYRGNVTAIARGQGKDASAFRALLRKHQLRPDRVPPFWDVRS